MSDRSTSSLGERRTESALTSDRKGHGALTMAVIVLATVATLGGVFGGPALGDHEALVAECARAMRLTGDWLVPRFLDTPFIRKPPLAYWLVATASYVFPNDPTTGLPVTTAAARLPSALAGLGTVLLLWRLGTMMFGRLAGVLAALMASSSAFILLYSPNATVEMVLTFCCTWAAMHFWCGVTSSSATRRFAHIMLCYVALGVGMLAKGPAPLALVAVPLAFWWYTHAAQRALARGGPHRFRVALRIGVRGLRRQTWRACSQLWLFPGAVVFLLLFVPWMIAVAQRHTFAWDLWDWQYLQRFQGDYEDTRVRGLLYYVPIAVGLIAPWSLALVEGLLAPWLARYRRQRRALYFIGCWAVLGTVVMSLMEFKKPYYIVPLAPALILLITPVVVRFVNRSWSLSKGLTRVGAISLPLIIALGGTVAYLQTGFREGLAGIVWCLGLLCAGLLIALSQAARGRALPTVVAAGFAVCISFVAGWHAVGPSLGNVERAAMLDQRLDEAGVPHDAVLYFADQRPDARLAFYFNRRPRHMIAPSQIVTRSVVRERGDRWLQDMAFERAEQLLTAVEPVYLLLDREHVPYLERLPQQLRKRIRVLTTIDTDSGSDGDDWIIVTNAAG